MSENRNVQSLFSQECNGTVCIDTHKVLDSCRDRDCFENARVYLTCFGEEILASASNIRAKSARVLYAYVGVDEVPFNCGFFQITIKYYVLIELEACLGIGRSQTFFGVSVLEKSVILYGGEGNVTAFSSDPTAGYCSPGSVENRSTNAPVAITEIVEPMVLGSKVVDCSCPCSINENVDIPECVRCCVDGEINVVTNAPRLYVSYGIFSVIRIVRPAQLLVSATDYSVPDKECVPATNDENPCALFNSMAFPTASFKTGCINTHGEKQRGQRGGCGCSGNR